MSVIVFSCLLTAIYMVAGVGFYRLVKRASNWDAHPIMILTWPIFLLVVGLSPDDP